MDEITITILFVTGMFWLAFISFWEAGNAYEYGFITPKYFYEEWELNWFGSWFMFILLSIVSPICTIIKLVYITWCLIYYGVKWLFTVGR